MPHHVSVLFNVCLCCVPSVVVSVCCMDVVCLRNVTPEIKEVLCI